MPNFIGSCLIVSALNPSECAAWVQAWAGIFQALGAIVALGLTLWLWRRDRHERDRQARRFAIGMAAHGVLALGEVIGATSPVMRETLALRVAQLGTVLQIGRGARVEDLSADAAFEYLAVLGALAQGELAASRFVDATVVHEGHMRTMLQPIMDAAKAHALKLNVAVGAVPEEWLKSGADATAPRAA